MKASRLWDGIRIFLTWVFLFLIWIVFTWKWTGISVAVGAAGSLLIAIISFRVFIPSHQAALNFIIPNPFYLVLYILYIPFALYRSSFQVLLTFLKGTENPRIVHFRTHLRSDIARTALALSITLTPGTICLDLNDDHLTVHWLTCDTTHSKEAGKKITGKMEYLLGRMFN